MLPSRLGNVVRALVQGSENVEAANTPGEDVSLSEDLTIGELVLDWLVSEYGRENAGETINRCERILQLLAPGEAGFSPWRPVVLRTAGCLALTAPGRAIYLSEGLLQLAGDDDAPVALTFAHEIAHHTLGHLASGTDVRWREWLGEAAGLPLLARAQINRMLFSRAQELAADREALANCHRAGFALDHCLTLFDILSRWEEGGQELGETATPDWMSGDAPFRSWLRERWTGYPSLQHRREMAAVEVTILKAQ